MRVINLILIFTYFLGLPVLSQTSNKFQKKISGYLSKDEVEKAENFCEQLKSPKERAECYVFMGDKALGELEYSKAMIYFFRSKNTDKLHTALLEALKNGEQEKTDNFLVRNAKNANPNASEEVLKNKAFMPIADLCYKKKDYKNAAYYYDKADVKQLSVECKVLHAINTKDYIAVVELSEKETIGLRNTLEVYKKAADQYYAKGDYANASRCYKKVGDKSKEKLCFKGAKEFELTKVLSIIKSNRIDFSENPSAIAKKLKNTEQQVVDIERIVSEYKKNGYAIEADNWTSFSKHLKNLISESNSGVYIINEKTQSGKDGKYLLEQAWNHINKIAIERKLGLTKQEQQPIITTLKEILLLKENQESKIEKMANKQLVESGVNPAKNIYQIPKATGELQKLIDDYFFSINSKETPKATAWFIFGIVEQMHNGYINKLKKLEDATSSGTIKTKCIEQKLSFLKHIDKLLEESTYMKSSYSPSSWNDYLIQKAMKAMKGLLLADFH